MWEPTTVSASSACSDEEKGFDLPTEEDFRLMLGIPLRGLDAAKTAHLPIARKVPPVFNDTGNFAHQGETQ